MGRGTIPLTQALGTTERDEEIVNVRLTFRQLKILAGHVRGTCRRVIREEENDRRKRGGKAFVPAPGKVNIRDGVRARMIELERCLCTAADIASAFDDKGNFTER